ncbi:1-phosphatidylinositol 4,5-bisphosphate phosphodiesterase classes I and II-like [Littorina saxatilis]|uniref:1-phosphatidylinositol 4,5-bisphosphate phosphodiesterase classes I and II-like n=1 Tax=Littorina saxatilis TaxID=31220 RepID=UPI0038B50457
MDCLDIALIRDTRTGKYARVPKDGKLKESLIIGAKDVPLEDKTVSVFYGTDMVNIEWMNFVCSDKETAKLWTDELLTYSVNLLSANSSTLCFLEKWHNRVLCVLGTDGKIPLKNVVKQIASNREDKRKVEKALESAGLLNEKNDAVEPSKLTFENFFNFYIQLTGRSEVDLIFQQLGAKKKPYLTVEQFTEFLNRYQRDPRLNEILYPFVTVKRAQEIINQHESKRGFAAKGHLSQEGFLRFLMSEFNNLIPSEALDLSEDMTQPLAHYFINSSHNTYLTGHQFTGKSSVEVYRQVLLSGCRCIELDCWDGKGQDEEPMITHGYTMCTEIPFKDVIEAIAESAFKTSDYPVILSFENHCGPKQQAKMANYCRDIFGEMLLDAPLDSHPLKPEVPLPSPDMLKRKILVKNKKKHFHKGGPQTTKPMSAAKLAKAEAAAAAARPKTSGDAEDDGGNSDKGDGDVSSTPASPTGRKPSGTESSPTHGVLQKGLSVCSEGEKGELDVFDSDSDSSDSDDDETVAVEMSEEEKRRRQRVKRDKGTAGKEAEAALEMSALVNYIQPIHFHSFEASEKRDKSYEISSFVETQATSCLKESPVDFVNYNKRQLSRIYPRGTRVDSSNFMPQVFWNAGCQLVALNFQTLDLAMQINLGIFEYNGRSGYVLKPDFMRRNDRHFDPFAESTVDGIVAGSVAIKVLSGQFMSDKRVGTYVEVDMYGLPTDTVRKKFRTKTVPNNGLNPVYEDDPFVFKKVVLPNLAIIRLGVYEETGKLIGHRIMPVEGLRPGYRHVPLRNESNQALMLPTIFVYIEINDYVPDGLAAYADALLNPIAYISQLEKHAHQLEILTEDFDSDVSKPTHKISEEKKDEADGLPNSAIKDLGDKMNQRQNSVNSKPNRVDMSPTTENKSLPSRPSLNRMGSSPHMMISKQESVQSANSQSSTGSGKMLTLSDANLRLLLCGNLNRMTSSSMLGENGTAGTFAQNSKLNDSAILKPTPLEELKTCKAYLKAVAKRDKDLENMRRKHEKAREILEEQQQMQLDKLIASQTRARIALEKTHTKTLKKMAKCGENTEQKQQVFKGELQAMLQAQDQEHREMKYKHADVMMGMSKDHFQVELEVYKRHHNAIYDALYEVMTANHNCHKKALDEIHDRDVVELKKAMDPQIREHMKQLAKKHKDKQELSRIKREAQQKHVGAVVTERQRLIDLLDKRKGDLQEKLDEVRKEAEKEKEEFLKRYQKEYEEHLQKLEEVFEAEVQAFGIDEDDNEEDNNADRNTVSNGNQSISHPTENGTADNSPSKGPHVSTVLVNGANSPTKDTAPEIKDTEGSGKSPEFLDKEGKVNSQEELTNM